MSTENNNVNENDDTRTRIIGSDASESTLRMGEDNNSTVRLSEPAAQSETPKEQPGSPKSRKLLWIIIAAVIVIGGGIAAFLLLSGDKGTDKDKDAAKSETIEEVIGTNNTDISDFIDNAVDARLDKSSDQAGEDVAPATDTVAVMW